MNKVRKALISGICLMIGIILLSPLISVPSENGMWQAFGIDVFLKFVGGLFILFGIAYWFYVWPDEFHSGKAKVEEDIAIHIDEHGGPSQNKDSENIYQAGIFCSMDQGMGRGHVYFGGADLLNPNRPKDR